MDAKPIIEGMGYHPLISKFRYIATLHELNESTDENEATLFIW